MIVEQNRKAYLYKRVVQAKLFIDGHHNNNIDLPLIAAKACFSKYHFIRLFKLAYGQTPHNYLTKVRVNHAEHLLAAAITVADVSTLVGFESSTSFTAVFKKQVGMPPSVFQYKQKQKQEKIKANPLNVVPACFAASHGWHK